MIKKQTNFPQNLWKSLVASALLFSFGSTPWALGSDLDRPKNDSRPLIESQTTRQQTSRISGRVTDRQGVALAGASIKVIGTNLVSSTNEAGEFSITVEPGTYAIEVSYVSFKAATRTDIQVSREKAAALDIVLEDDNVMLNDIVVTALGITRASKSVGYSLQKVDGDEIKEAHETNLLNSMSGKVAGVNITNSSGGVGASSTIQIRGQNFVGGYNYNNSPLFVVDGVPISNNNEQSTRAFTGRQDFNNPNFT